MALDADGSVAWAAGAPDLEIFPQSALKPLQAVVMVGAGLDAPLRLLAVVCASHDGRPEHLAAVREILAGAGLLIYDLDNTPSWPPMRRRCSPSRTGGEHGGFDHPELQRQACGDAGDVRDQRLAHGRVPVALPPRATADPRRSGACRAGAVSAVGVDGCGAPAPVMTLLGVVAPCSLAVSGHAVHHAMTTHPEMVGGPTRDVTLLMQAVPGLLCKDGAEGVQVAGAARRPSRHRQGRGRRRPACDAVTVAALQSLGVELDPAVFTEAVLGHGDPVGAVGVTRGRGVSGGPEFRPLDGRVDRRVEVAPGLRRTSSPRTRRSSRTAAPARTSWAPGQVAVVDPGPDLGTDRVRVTRCSPARR